MFSQELFDIAIGESVAVSPVGIGLALLVGALAPAIDPAYRAARPRPIQAL